MKSRSTIFSEIYEQLTSDNWLQVRNSLVGKELIALGAEIVYQSELVKDSLNHVYDYKTASIQELYKLANIEDCAISTIYPSTITVDISSLPNNIAFQPFSIQCRAGVVNYWNIDTALAKQGSVTLYAGDVFKYYNGTGTSVNWQYTQQQLQPYTSISASTGTETYFKLTDNAYPSSIYMFNDGKVVTKSNPVAESTADATYFCPINDEDGSIETLLFNVDRTKLVEVYFLDASTVAPQINYVDTNRVKITAKNVDYVVDVLSTTQGSVSVENARNVLIKHYGHTRYLANKTDLEEYACAYQFIQDAEVTFHDNVCTTYVIPTNENDTAPLDYLAVNFATYGDMYSKYAVSYGTPISYDIVIKGNLTPIEQTLITDMLNETFAYVTCKFDNVISTQDITGRIVDKIGRFVLVTLEVSEDFKASIAKGRLSFPPIPNSLRVTDPTGAVVITDTNGVFQAPNTTSSTQVVDTACAISPTGSFGMWSSGFVVKKAYNLGTAVIQNGTTKDYTYRNQHFAEPSFEFASIEYPIKDVYVNDALTTVLEEQTYANAKYKYFLNPVSGASRGIPANEILDWASSALKQYTGGVFADAELINCTCSSSDIFVILQATIARADDAIEHDTIGNSTTLINPLDTVLLVFNARSFWSFPETGPAISPVATFAFAYSKQSAPHAPIEGNFYYYNPNAVLSGGQIIRTDTASITTPSGITPVTAEYDNEYNEFAYPTAPNTTSQVYNAPTGSNLKGNPTWYYGANSYYGTRMTFNGRRFYVQVATLGEMSGLDKILCLPTTIEEKIECDRENPFKEIPARYLQIGEVTSAINTPVYSGTNMLQGLTTRNGYVMFAIDNGSDIVLTMRNDVGVDMGTYPLSAMNWQSSEKNTILADMRSKTAKWNSANNPFFNPNTYKWRMQSSYGNALAFVNCAPTSGSMVKAIIIDNPLLGASAKVKVLDMYQLPTRVSTTSTEDINIAIASVSEASVNITVGIWETAVKVITNVEPTDPPTAQPPTRVPEMLRKRIEQVSYDYITDTRTIAPTYHPVDVVGSIDYTSGSIFLTPDLPATDLTATYRTNSVYEPQEGMFMKYNQTRYE